MTATDELRKLLTECGVEWETDGSGFRVMWGQPVSIDQMQFKAVDNALPNGGLNISICGFSPEQAITATLGSGKLTADDTCHIKELDALTQTLSMAYDCAWGECSGCGCLTPDDSTYCINCGAKVEGEER